MTINKKLTEQFHNYCNKSKLGLNEEVSREVVEDFLSKHFDGECKYQKSLNGKDFFKVNEETYLVSGLHCRSEVKFY